MYRLLIRLIPILLIVGFLVYLFFIKSPDRKKYKKFFIYYIAASLASLIFCCAMIFMDDDGFHRSENYKPAHFNENGVFVSPSID